MLDRISYEQIRDLYIFYVIVFFTSAIAVNKREKRRLLTQDSVGHICKPNYYWHHHLDV